MAGGTPTPIFDIKEIRPYTDYGEVLVKENFHNSFDDSNISFCHDEYRYVVGWLYMNKGSNSTLKNYSKELERYCAWAWQYKGISILGSNGMPDLKIRDGNEYIEFMVSPPSHWIGHHTFAKFNSKGEPNKKWRPFISRDSKYRVSDNSLSITFSVLSSFYKYAVADGKAASNPFSSIKQIKGLVRTQRTAQNVMKITNLQWQYLIETATYWADQEPEIYERSLFIISIMLNMYLRVSDLIPRKDNYRDEEYIPLMSDFKRENGTWVFKALGKGNVVAHIPCSNAVIESLKRWRKYLGLSALPAPNDKEYLIPSLRTKEPIRSANQISNIVNKLFELTAKKMCEDGLSDETGELLECSAHWMRHTGISRDIQIRPREHVREDARHSSFATTDKYIDTSLRDRAETSLHKTLIPE